MDIHIGQNKMKCVVPAAILTARPDGCKEKRIADMANKIDELTDQAAAVAASVVSAPFKFADKFLSKLFWWV